MRLRDILEGKTEDAQNFIFQDIKKDAELTDAAKNAKDAKGLKNTMIDRFPVHFPSAGKIQFDQIEWETLFDKIEKEL